MRDAQKLGAPPEFIVVAERKTLDSAMETVEGSAAGYLAKPVDVPRLGRIVRRVFERRRPVRENAGLQEEIQGRLAESEALLLISSTVRSTLDTPEALRRIFRALATLLRADTPAPSLNAP